MGLLFPLQQQLESSKSVSSGNTVWVLEVTIYTAPRPVEYEATENNYRGESLGVFILRNFYYCLIY